MSNTFSEKKNCTQNRPFSVPLTNYNLQNRKRVFLYFFNVMWGFIKSIFCFPFARIFGSVQPYHFLSFKWNGSLFNLPSVYIPTNLLTYFLIRPHNAIVSHLILPRVPDLLRIIISSFPLFTFLRQMNCDLVKTGVPRVTQYVFSFESFMSTSLIFRTNVSWILHI